MNNKKPHDDPHPKPGHPELPKPINPGEAIPNDDQGLDSGGNPNVPPPPPPGH